MAFTPPTVAYSPTGGTVTPGNLLGSPTWRAWGSLGPSATARDTLRIGVGSAVADLGWNRVLSPANLARGAARALPYVAVGSLIYAAFEAVRCRSIAGGGIECDMGSDPSQQSATLYRFRPTQAHPIEDFASRGAACSAWQTYLNAQSAAVQYSVTGGTETASNYTCYMNQVTYTCSQGGTYPNCTNGSVSTSTKNDPYGSGNKVSGTVAGCASGVVGPDGKCATGTYVQTQPDTAAQRVTDYSPQWPTQPAQVAQQAAEHVDLAPYAEPAAQPLTGPTSVPGPIRTTTTTDAQGNTSTQTQQTVTNMTYQGDTYNTTTTIVTTNNDGSTTVEERPVEIEVCGLPSTPPCKIDESGTPSSVADSAARSEVATAVEGYRQAIEQDIATIQEPTFGFIGAPPIVACSPIEFPFDIGSLDPCGVVEPVRAIMAYVWALVAAWLALGWIREAANGA